MADFPALPLYTDAFLGDTSHLDATETGAYLSLLMAAWRSPGCCLPDDPVRLARMARCDTRTWNRIKDTVMAFWAKGDDGMWRQKRLSKTLAACNTSRQRKREAAEETNRKLAERRSVGKPNLKLLKNNDRTDAERNGERDGERGAERDGESNASRSQSDTHTISISNTSISSPPCGGAERARAQASPLDEWEAKVRAIEGFGSSGLAISSMAPLAALQRDGFSLTAEIIPVLKADLASAQAKGRLNRLSWGTIEKKVREARCAGPDAIAIPRPIDWQSRLENARKIRLWPKVWGPLPNEPGCVVPAELIHPDDGHEWTWLEDSA